MPVFSGNKKFKPLNSTALARVPRMETCKEFVNVFKKFQHYFIKQASTVFMT